MQLSPASLRNDKIVFNPYTRFWIAADLHYSW